MIANMKHVDVIVENIKRIEPMIKKIDLDLACGVNNMNLTVACVLKTKRQIYYETLDMLLHMLEDCE
jgi:hypothetical protein